MKMKLQVLHQIYHWLLRFYPGDYRAEYGDELQTVFYLSMEDAIKRGKFAAAKVFLLEVFHLPGAIVSQHLRERRKNRMLKKIDHLFDFSAGSLNETIVALAPFLVLAGLPILFGILGTHLHTPFWQIAGPVLGLSLYASFPLLVIVGFLKGLPRWSLPYLGLLLPALAWYISDAVADYNGTMLILRFLSPIPYSWPFLREFIKEGITWGWMLLIPLSLLLIPVSMLIPGLRPFYRNLRNDWTLLCFMLSGAAPFMAIIHFEGYRNYDAFIVLMFLSLAVAGWLYLQSNNPWAKFLILIGGVTMAMLIAAVGQTLLFESSEFQVDVSLNTVQAWIWLLLAMVLSLAINLLPRVGHVDHVDETGVHTPQENT